MKNEFTLAFNEVLEEKQLPKDVILKALESAMVSAYRRAVNASQAQHVEARIDPDTGRVLVFAEKEIVDSAQDDRTEVSLSDARKVNPQAELGEMIIIETTPADFGRVAAQTARQVIQQRIREAERNAQLTHFEKQLGEIVSGVVQAVNSQGVTVGLDMKAEGVMMRKEMIPGERFKVHDRVRALIFEVKDGPRGPQIMLSRAHRNFLRRLLENEVPEIYHGVVEVRSIAREPGERAKVAVAAAQQGIDPVGACVGIRGVRIQAIVRELHDEKIDVIEWNNDSAVYIAKAISPARVSGVYLNEGAAGGKTATVVVPEDQLSLAIGRDGQNARLAAKLTSWRIDIKSLPEAVAESLHKLLTDPSMAALREMESDLIPVVEAALAKKAEGRPLSPEEYDMMTQLMDRVERRTANRRQAERKAEEARLAALRQQIAPQAFELSLLDSDLSEHIANLLQEAGYLTMGDLIMQMKQKPDVVLALQGIGPKAMQDIQRVSSDPQFAFVEPAPIVEAEPVASTEPVAEALVAEEVVPGTVEPVEVETQAPVEMAEPGVEEPVIEIEQVGLPEAVAEAPAEVVTEEVEESIPSLEEMFTLAPEALVFDGNPEEEEEEGGSAQKKGKKGKKRRHAEIVYDPDRDLTIVRKKHKRGDGWEWEE